MKKPKTVLKLWLKLCHQVKKDKTKRKAPGRREAKKYAAMCGMKSMLEVEVAADAANRGIDLEYEKETLEYQHSPQKYTPDFTPAQPCKKNPIIEVKGKMTAEVRKKLISIKRCNPDRKICLVFGYANNKLSARPNATRYWQWAEQNGFLWSEKSVKKEWFK